MGGNAGSKISTKTDMYEKCSKLDRQIINDSIPQVKIC
jgi:hypothetical protein